MKIRMVAGADLVESGLFKKLQEEGHVLPNPLLTVGWIGESLGMGIIAHGILHSLPIVEYVHAEENHGFFIKPIVEQIEDFVKKSGAPRVLAHTNHRAMLRVISRIGFKEPSEPWFEWRKE